MKKGLCVNDLDQWLKRRKQVSDFRQILILEGVAAKPQNTPNKERTKPLSSEPSKQVSIVERSALYNALQSIDEHYQDCLLVTRFLDDIETPFTHCIAARSLGHQQGFEYDALVLDCMAGLHPNQLYNAAGLVKKSGLLVLLAPSPSKWPKYFASHTQIKFSQGDSHELSYFAQLLLAYFSDKYDIAWWTEEKKHLSVCDHVVSAPLMQNSSSHYSESFTLSSAQQAILDKVEASWSLSEHQQVQSSCHLITGARGRGKTSLLARIAEQGIESHAKQRFSEVILCTPSPLQNELIQHYMDESYSSSSQLVSIAPDQVERVTQNSLLLIDEAASIAPWLLTTLCNKAAHSILCSTTQGYEGSGKGLLYRWLPNFQGNIVHHQLMQSFRWLEHDPIERLFTAIFEPESTFSPVALTDTNNFQLYKVGKQDFIDDPELYASCFALLQTAHYQSTPIDHMRMLDANDHQIWLYASGNEKPHANSIVGVICTIEEGGELIFDDVKLRQDVASGRRRLQGHMTSQALALHLASEQVLTHPVCRVHRIAVQPSLHRQGFASAMLKALRAQLNSESGPREVSLSSAFGITDALYDFWASNGFSLVKIGQRKDSSSGTLTGYLVDTNSPLYISNKVLFKDCVYLDLAYLHTYQNALHDLLPPSIISLEHKLSTSPALNNFILSKLHSFMTDELSYTMLKSVLHHLSTSQTLHPVISNTEGQLEITTALQALHTKHLSKSEKLEYVSKLKNAIMLV
jgi:tRNA(Met) cytidine acetyltransferase